MSLDPSAYISLLGAGSFLVITLSINIRLLRSWLGARYLQILAVRMSPLATVRRSSNLNHIAQLRAFSLYSMF